MSKPQGSQHKPTDDHAREAPNPCPWHARHLWQIIFVRDLFLIVLALFVLLFGYYLRSIFTPVLIALALAYLFHPIIGALQRRWRVSRPAAIGVILGSVFLVLLVVVGWVLPIFVEQLVGLAIVARDTIKDSVDKIPPQIYADIAERVTEGASLIEADPWSFLADQFTLLFAGGTNIVTDVIGATTYITLTAFLIPLYFFIIACQFNPLVGSLKNYIPASSRERTIEVVGIMDEIVNTYFRSRVLISLIMGVLLSLGWAIAGVPFWFILGMSGGVLSLIPFASAIVWPLAVGLMVLESLQSGVPFDWIAVVIWPSLVFGFVQVIEGWVLTPLLQGRSLNMSAMAILIAVFIGGAIGGLYGLILCIPVAACIKILATEIFLPSLREWAQEN